MTFGHFCYPGVVLAPMLRSVIHHTQGSRLQVDNSYLSYLITLRDEARDEEAYFVSKHRTFPAELFRVVDCGLVADMGQGRGPLVDGKKNALPG